MAAGGMHDMNGQGRRLVLSQDAAQGPRSDVLRYLIGKHAGQSDAVGRGVDRRFAGVDDEPWLDRDGKASFLAIKGPAIWRRRDRGKSDASMVSELTRILRHTASPEIGGAGVNTTTDFAGADG